MQVRSLHTQVGGIVYDYFEYYLNPISSVLILLTPKEALELTGKVKSINSDIGNHIHVDNEEYTREITIAIYTPQNLSFFDDRIRKIIEDNSAASFS